MFKQFIAVWSPIVAVGTVILLVSYAGIQQNYRQGANDPQIELVENAKIALNNGLKVDSFFVNTPKIDMSTSLSLFAMIFDDLGNPLASTAYNGSSSPLLLPKGLFEYVRANGQDRVTWETVDGLRFAAVVGRFESAVATGASASLGNSTSSGFILAARSLREIEKRIDNLAWMTFVGWILLLIVSSICSYITAAILKKSPQ